MWTYSRTTSNGFVSAMRFLPVLRISLERGAACKVASTHGAVPWTGAQGDEMYKPFDLTGKVALITGGNGGIGLGMAEALAEAGADVCIWGTNAGKSETAKTRLGKTGRKIEALVVDVSDEAAAETAMADTVKRLGRVDACFANAGVTGRAKSMFELDGKEWRRVLAVNLDGAFFTLRAAARHMVARAEKGDPGGRLVGIASLAARSGAARNEHYAATKGGLVAMLKATAVEF